MERIVDFLLDAAVYLGIVVLCGAAMRIAYDLFNLFDSLLS